MTTLKVIVTFALVLFSLSAKSCPVSMRGEDINKQIDYVWDEDEQGYIIKFPKKVFYRKDYHKFHMAAVVVRESAQSTLSRFWAELKVPETATDELVVSVVSYEKRSNKDISIEVYWKYNLTGCPMIGEIKLGQ